MSERKATSRHHSPVFDSQLTRKHKRTAAKKPPTATLAAPFPIQCLRCGEHSGPGRKLNARKVEAKGRYLGTIRIYRFFVDCALCGSQMCLRTRPHLGDYVCESGAVRVLPGNTIGQDSSEVRPESLERERQEQKDSDIMADLEEDACEQIWREMERAVVDAVNEMRLRNARLEIELRLEIYEEIE